MKWLGLLVTALCCCMGVSDAVYFYVRKEDDRCFVVDIPADTSFHVEYESPDTTDTLKSVVQISAPDADAPGQTKVAKKQIMATKGAIPFTSTESGLHKVCVDLDSMDFALPSTAFMRVSLRIAMGARHEDYQDIARKSNMDDLQLSILKLRDRVRAILRNQDYAKEKSLQLQKSIESNNNETTWVSLFQIGLLLFTGVYQARHLKAYLHTKKLV